MKRITITKPADVRVGDIATLSLDGVIVTGPVKDCGKDVHVPLREDSFNGACTDDGWKFLHATREVPEWEPGTVYEITTLNGDTERAWYLKRVLGGSAFVTREGDEFTVEELASIQPVPDDAEALRAEVERLRAARTRVTRREIADAIWPDVSESARDGLAKSDIVGRVYALANGTGGAS